MTTTEEPQAMTAHAAWNAVMEEVRGLRKSELNRQQGFAFRGIDSVLNAVGPALRKHGVAVVPYAVSVVSDERYQTAKGGQMQGVTVSVDYTIYGPEGDHILGAALGAAADSGDKAVPKAMAVALRTFLLQALCLPTDEPDPDAEAHERAAVDPRDAARGQAWEATANRATSREAREQLWKDKHAELGRAPGVEDYQQWAKEWAAS